MDATATTITVSNNEVFAGGLITTAGTKPSFRFAHWTDMTTAAAANAPLPRDFVLHQNHPNPLNPTTVIQYTIPQSVQVKLTIYNLLGEKIRTPVDAKEFAGAKQVLWDGQNHRGQRVASGIYLYRLEAGDFTMTRRLVLTQ